MSESDHQLAHRLAAEAAERLATMQTAARRARRIGWDLEDAGDRDGHEFLVEALRAARPDDAILSEEGHDDGARLGKSRVWIVDPLDGSSSFGSASPEWAVHVALTIDGRVDAAAVAVPGLGTTLGSGSLALGRPSPARDRPVIVTGRSRSWNDGRLLAEALDADLIACSSAGVKAALVALGEADLYVHDAPLYEWDVCAPVGVAKAADLVAVDSSGRAFVFNQSRPVVPGLVIGTESFAERALDVLRYR